MNTCKNCKFFSPWQVNGVGECDKMIYSPPDYSALGIINDPRYPGIFMPIADPQYTGRMDGVIIDPDDCCSCHVLIGENFGCIHHEPK